MQFIFETPLFLPLSRSSLSLQFRSTNLYTPEICCPVEEPNVCTTTSPTPCCDRQCAAIREFGSGAASLISHTLLLTSLSLLALLAAVM